MGLFDAFSSSDESRSLWQGDRKFQKKARAAQGEIDEWYGQGADALKGAEPRALAALDSGVDQAIDKSSAYYDQAAAPWNPLLDQGMLGVKSHWEMLQNPDNIYDSELFRAAQEAGIDQLNRGAAARGMLASGNNTIDQIDYMRQHGIDYFNTLMNQRQPYFGMAQNAAQGISNVRAGQANNTMNLFDRLGANKSNVITGTAGGLSNLYGRQGDSLANILLKRGQSKLDTSTNVANAQSAADANLWGAILGVGNLGTSAYRGYQGV